MSPEQKYSDEDILEMLRRCAKEHTVCSPRTLKETERTCSPSLVLRRFGSWSEAKKQAGIEDEPNVGGRKKEYSNADILHQIRECADNNDGHCTVQLMREGDYVSPSVAVSRFGSWIEAKRRAGLDTDERSTNSRPRQYTDEDYLELLKECKEKHGKVTKEKFNEESKRIEGHPTAGAVRKRFGTWNKAKERAGIEESTRSYTDDELLDMMRKCKQKHGKVSASTFAADQEFCSPETIQRRFGKWNDAKEKAGV